MTILIRIQELFSAILDRYFGNPLFLTLLYFISLNDRLDLVQFGRSIMLFFGPYFHGNHALFSQFSTINWLYMY